MLTEKLYEPTAFVEHFKTSPSGVLFHYTGQAGLLGIIKNAELWATKIQYMNDATEFGLALRLVRQELENISSYTKHPTEKSAAAALQASLRGIEDINIFAICFCEQGDLLSQWRGYGHGNSGYAVGFNTDALMELSGRAEFTLGRCIYDAAVQGQIVQEAVAHCIQNELSFPTKSSWGFHGPLADILFRCGAFFKDASFAEEKEWRLVSPTILYHDERLHFRAGGSMISPYFALPIMNEGILPIPYVVVGPCPHMELSKSAVTALLMHRGNRGPLQGQQVAVGSMVPFRNW
jgi:hypothetical protein